MREELGISQSELAERSGVHAVAISRIESELRDAKNITLATIVALANALGASVDELLT